jgi:hypothetical protein
MVRGISLALGIMVLVVIVAFAADYSVKTSTCMACHSQEASYAQWMQERLKAEKKGFSHELIACADCHIQGSPDRTVLSKLRGLLHTVSYLVPQIDPRKPEVTGLFNKTRIPADNCRSCHNAAVYRQAVAKEDLPGGLKEIGLLMDHRKHVLARDDQCAKCHERFKDQTSAKADRGVTYTEVNHLACDSCHSRASHAYRTGAPLPLTDQEFVEAREVAWEKLSTNPRWMIPFPSEATCRRCHNGKVHYKTVIFLCDCREGSNYENCLKCHPQMTRTYFDNYLKKRQQTATEGPSSGAVAEKSVPASSLAQRSR